MTEAQIDGPVREMIEATNAEDRDRLLAAFAPDAVLVDFGRRFVGREEIGGWSDLENIGTHNRITATNISPSSEEVEVEIEVTGDGYNGTGLLSFALDGDQITTLQITG
jgi:ketosteroid isomerase-like protein